MPKTQSPEPPDTGATFAAKSFARRPNVLQPKIQLTHKGVGAPNSYAVMLCRTLELIVASNGSDVAYLLGYYARRGFVDEGRRLLSRSLAS